tara:strand:+ start:34252 stop:38064 length:3813 start_codon:yes stop_codon:yes gene_type:complete
MKNKFAKIKAPTKKELLIIRILVFLGVLCTINFLYWFSRPEFKSNSLLYWLLSITICYNILRKFYMWYHYISISVPKTPKLIRPFTVDILTTYFPGEPYEMIVETLEAIQKITYPHTTYLCDEANDPYLIAICKKLGVKHITRTNRINAKAGNINNALQYATGEICLILDPDHVPFPNFLDPVLPHFQNEEIGFVQVVQSYYNIRETLVARGAAEQTFQFYGPMMMSMNTYGTVNAIGANCTFRRAALDSIGGHAPGLSEDMHTAMLLHAKGWKSLYVPQVLARGLAPSSLTSFFKQQLKWSRGTFDLLFYVYPKVFKKFTKFQKIHYALLPLHYLVGVTYLINFLIPILSLLLSKTPWSGNIIFFAIMVLPVSASTLLIRAYIQKWVIEKKERGFHIMGGLLQITTWWVYFLGFIYTIIKKKIPYLPTPKDGEETTNLAITIPNIAIGCLSIFAIFYGLNRDLTPFSVFMALFALINTFFMFFSVYLATRTTNSNHILRNLLEQETISTLVGIKTKFQKLSNSLFNFIRPLAFPLLISTILIAFFTIQDFNNSKWKNVEADANSNKKISYLGIFQPRTNNGLSSLKDIDSIAKTNQIAFDIISLYLAWGDETKQPFPEELVSDIFKRKSIPMITWEPWSSDFAMNDTIAIEKKERNILLDITKGKYDVYIERIAKEIASFEKPIFLRFAHEFDNPAYPWSQTGGNSPKEFINAWRYVHKHLNDLGATNVVWVWNPWKSEAITSYYPGDTYVDWVGVTGLNYGSLNKGGQWYDFETLYTPYHNALAHLKDKPVIVAEFGSLQQGGNQQLWTQNAIKTINKSEFKEIKAIVLFNSNLDHNIPVESSPNETVLDWTNNNLSYVAANYKHGLPEYLLEKTPATNLNKATEIAKKVFDKPFHGVQYKKGLNWTNNQYVATRDNLKADFLLMHKIGINLIRFEGQNIYDYNILNYSKDFDLNVIYSFWIDSETDFVLDSKKLEKQKQEILQSIKKYKNESHIIAWNIGNSNWNNLENNFDQPILNYQKMAYLKWLKELAVAIKKVDSSRVLSCDILLNKYTEAYRSAIFKQRIPIDYFGLIIKDTTYISSLSIEPLKTKIPTYIADIDPEVFNDLTKYLNKEYVVLRNWQDQWESNQITFDGILDRKGRRKPAFEKIKGLWKTKVAFENKNKIQILLPAVLLYTNNTEIYRALIYENNKWNYPADDGFASKLEWSLIKNDEFGNSLAMKYLGKGARITITIPEDYERYEILLSLEKDGIISSTKSKLNIPLINKK